MALKVELKAGERVIIGTAVIRNGDTRARLFIEGEAPILREKDIVTVETADSPAKKIYLAVQLMYMSGDLASAEQIYFPLVYDFLTAAPSSLPLIDQINNFVLNSDLYKALKAAKSLVAYEKELIGHATLGASAYARVSQTVASPRELEAALLMKAAHRLQVLADGWSNGTSDLLDAITFNRKVWTVLASAATDPDNPLPDAVKTNIAQLAAAIFKRTIDIQIEPAPHKLKMLIGINQNIAAGLRSRPRVAA